MEATGTAVALEKTKPEPKRKGTKRNRKGGGCVYQPKFETKKDKAINAAASAAWRALGADPDTKPKKTRSRLGSWRIKYIWQHRSYDEKVDVETKGAAQEILKQRFAEMKNGQFIKGSDAETLRYEDMRNFLFRAYEKDGCKSLWTARDGKTRYIGHLKHLDEFFRGRLALDINAHLIDDFVLQQQRAGAAAGTINRAVALLRRMFYLAVVEKKLRTDHIPNFTMLKEPPARKGFLECEDFPRLRQCLPEYLRAPFTLAYYTGMRKGEICKLKWENIDTLGGEIRLEDTKNGEDRNVPLIGETGELLKIERARHPGCEWVFSRDARSPIKSFCKAWKSACVRAGLGRFTCRKCGGELDAKLHCASCQKRCASPRYVGLRFHDQRRSGIRNLDRAGVSQHVAMKISGHKTDSVYRRYNIVSARDLKEAGRRVNAYVSDRISQTRVKDAPDRASENDAPNAIVQ